MDRHHWRQVCDAFHQLFEEPEPARTQRLSQLGLTHTVRADVVRMLESDLEVRANGRFDFDRGLADFAADLDVNQRVGDYTLIRRLGAGGMGEVFLAESTHPKRSVAIKLLFASRLSPDTRRRFVAEADFLARLDHPSIAKVYQSGVVGTGSAQGRPYFVMEYIDGLPLDKYQAARQPDQAGRIRLLAGICAGAQHAHQKGVIHRDLKPANILVTHEGVPKIVDFGVARLVDADVDAQTATMTGHMLGTLAYMSPEQIASESSRIDTRSDVYALGVLGYELLVGRLPYDVQSAPLAKVVRVITSGVSSAALAEVKGDLRFVLRKALEVDPESRYSSAGEFEQDLRRLLSGAAVVARPSTPTYHLRVFWRTHRRLMVAIGFAAAILIAATTVSIGFSFRANRARAVAEIAQADLRDALNFLEDTLAQADPEVAHGQEPTVRRALNRVVARSGELQDKSTRASVLLMCSRLYLAIGTEGTETNTRALYTDALRLAEEACELLGGAQPHDSPKLAEALMLRGRSQFILGHYEPAVSSLQSAMAIFTQVKDADGPSILECRLRLATAYLQLGDFAKTRVLAERVLDVAGANHRFRANAHVLLGDVALRNQDFTSAERVYRRAVALAMDLPREQNLHAGALDKLGETLAASGRLDEAMEYQERALRIRREMFAGSHPLIARSLLALAAIQYRRGDYGQVLRLANEAEVIYRRAFDDPLHSYVLRSQSWRALALAKLDRLDEAIEVYSSLIAANEGGVGTQAELAAAYARRADLLLRSGQCNLAVSDFLAAEAVFSQTDQPHVSSVLEKLRARLISDCPGFNPSLEP